MSNKENSNLRLIMVAASRIEALTNHYIFLPAGLTSASFQILRILYIEGPKSPTSLLERLGSTKSNITQRLQNLEKKGLVSRVAEEGDKRSVRIALTDEGVSKINSIINQIETAERHMEKYFTPDELASHVIFFTKLHKLLNIYEINSFKNYEELI